MFATITPLSADAAEPALQLEKGARISLIGNTLADRMQHHDAWIDPATHQVQQTIYLATANTEAGDDKDNMFKILTQSDPNDVRDEAANGACVLESYDDTPTFDA